MKTKKIIVISDTHCGNRLGLTPPDWQPKTANSAPRGAIKSAQLRDSLWNWFNGELRKVGRADALIVNGDCIDGLGERSGGTELITSDREEQAHMAASVIKHINARKVFMTYGTAYHTGQGEDWENQVSALVGAAKIEAEGHYNVNGLAITCKHHIGNTSVPNSRTTALNRSQIRNLLWSDRQQQPRADVIIRSHVHRYAFTGDSGFLAITTPGLQGLGSKYGSRRCDGLPVDFGFVVFYINSKTEYSWEPHIMPLSLQHAEVRTI